MNYLIGACLVLVGFVLGMLFCACTDDRDLITPRATRPPK